MMVKVYVAGPITLGSQQTNLNQGIAATNELLNRGFAPYCPHLIYYLDIQRPRTWHDWMEYDEVWLKMCDCLLRLPGESKGADREVALARDLHMPVFDSVDELVAYYEWAEHAPVD